MTHNRSDKKGIETQFFPGSERDKFGGEGASLSHTKRGKEKSPTLLGILSTRKGRKAHPGGGGRAIRERPTLAGKKGERAVWHLIRKGLSCLHRKKKGGRGTKCPRGKRRGRMEKGYSLQKRLIGEGGKRYRRKEK